MGRFSNHKQNKNCFHDRKDENERRPPYTIVCNTYLT